MALQIVGVSGDVFTAGADPAPVPVFYVPYSQAAVFAMTVVMRVPQGDPALVLREAERTAWSLSPFTNVYAVTTMEQQLAELKWRQTFSATVLGVFAVVALALAAAGLYAVVSYTVAQRRRDIAVRMALGADAAAIVRDVLADAARMVAIGLVAGNVMSLLATRGLGGVLYGVKPGDPPTLVLASIGMAAIAVAGCVLPAISASRVDPQSALRS